MFEVRVHRSGTARVPCNHQAFNSIEQCSRDRTCGRLGRRTLAQSRFRAVCDTGNRPKAAGAAACPMATRHERRPRTGHPASILRTTLHSSGITVPDRAAP